MNCAKKDRPKAATFERPCPRLAPRTITKLLYQIPGGNASPNLDGGGGASPHVRMGIRIGYDRDRLADGPSVPCN